MNKWQNKESAGKSGILPIQREANVHRLLIKLIIDVKDVLNQK